MKGKPKPQEVNDDVWPKKKRKRRKRKNLPTEPIPKEETKKGRISKDICTHPSPLKDAANGVAETKGVEEDEAAEDGQPETIPPRKIRNLADSARHNWLHAQTSADLTKARSLYRLALKQCRAFRQLRFENEESISAMVLFSPELAAQEEELEEWELQVRTRLALLLCQLELDEEASKQMKRMGCVVRLARCILSYTLPIPQPSETDKTKTTSDIVVAYDDVLPIDDLSLLQRALVPTGASYWTDHDYCAEPNPSPYFSYAFALRPILEPIQPKKSTSTHTLPSSLGPLGRLVRAIYNLGLRSRLFDEDQVHYVEMWAHNRPHATGHQLHFDSDNEGRTADTDEDGDGVEKGQPRHPLASSVLYLTDVQGKGGPTLVTNQRLGDSNLATKGWLCHPNVNRAVLFDGSVLHGVIPGRGIATSKPLHDDNDDDDNNTVANGPNYDASTKAQVPYSASDEDDPAAATTNRVTIMVAFWDHIRIRPGKGPGSARPLPNNHPLTDNTTTMAPKTSEYPNWFQQLCCDPLSQDIVSCRTTAKPRVVEPRAIPQVWETLDGTAWDDSAPLPDYSKVFQGF